MSEVDICNKALRRIGTRTITSLTTDSSAEARACNEFYDDLRKAMLREHVWNFAVRRKALAQTGTTPTSEWEYEYTLPTNPLWLKTIQVAGNEAMTGRLVYSQEDDKILTDSTVVYLTYVADITDTTAFDPLFVDAFAYRIAMDLALAVAESRSTSETMERRYKDALHTAFAADAMDSYPEPLPEGSWVSARHYDQQIFNDER